MLKKFLGIFKRDKSVFSAEELKWQAEIVKGMKTTLYIILCIGSVVAFFLLGIKLVKILSSINLERASVTGKVLLIIIGMLLFAVYWIVVVVIPIVISDIIINRAFKLEEIHAQLQKNSKEKQTREFLSYIKEQEFSKLEMNWPMIDGLFQKFLECGMVQIELTEEGVNVSISNPTRDTDPLFIKHEELLTYFDFNEED